jgi:hypothetical protein
MAARRSTKKKKAAPRELLTIKGHLGPIGANEIEIRPLTVFIGRQGTGKSLVAQMLYFFRGLPSLVGFDVASRRPDEKDARDPRKIVRRIVDGMRSSHRSFASLTVPNVVLGWNGDLAVGGVHAQRRELSFNAQNVTRQIQPGKALIQLVEQVRDDAVVQPRTAVFIPTERLLYAMALGPASLRVISVPLILETFSQIMEVAGRVQADWKDGEPDTAQGRWVRDRLRDALGGEARMRGESWKWSFDAGGKTRQIDFDMASSGQRANWPLSLIPQVLFSLRARGELADGFTLYVEEPEIHLHPDAERAVVEVLAYLVKNGFRVVITTHSLTVLYEINNLVMASELPGRALAKEIPAEIRLRRDDVAAYQLTQDGSVTSLVSDEGMIDERELGRVADDLAMQFTRIMALRGPQP